MEVRISKKFYKGVPEDFFKYCKKSFGNQTAKLIAKIMGNAQAAKDLSILVRPGFPGRWHWLTGIRKHQISADLLGLNRLIFIPIEETEIFMDLKGTGNLDNTKVRGLILIEIADTHDE